MTAPPTTDAEGRLADVWRVYEEWCAHTVSGTSDDAEMILADLSDALREDGDRTAPPPTDAEVNAAGAVLYERWGSFTFDGGPDDPGRGIYGLVRDALIAARKVRHAHTDR